MSADDAVRDEAERCVLGAMLLSGEAIAGVAEALRAGDFYRPAHATIFAAIVDMHGRREPVDPLTVAHALAEAGDLGKIGGAPYLHTLMTAVPTAANATHYARIVAESAQRRRLAELSDRLRQVAEVDDGARRAELVAAVREGLDAVACPVAGARRHDSWLPVDLEPYLRGEVRRPEPTLGLARDDGVRLLYPGKEHAVIGEMEAGKSWLCLAGAAAELAEGRPVLYVHFEESDPTDTVERLLALGVPDAAIVKLFRFVGPERAVTAEALARLLDPAPSLVIFDGVNEAMALHGWGIREEDGAAAYRRYLVKPCLRAGAATLSGDHVVKDVERRGRNALGSVHKGNGLSGALILLENAEPFGRNQRGRSHVYVTKDRPGHLRRHGEPTKTPGKTYIGELTVDDTRIHVPWTDVQLWAPKQNDAAHQETASGAASGSDDEQVLAAVQRIAAAGKVANLRTVRAAAEGLGKDRVDAALVRLVLADRLNEGTGARTARVFTVAEDQPPTGGDEPP